MEFIFGGGEPPEEVQAQMRAHQEQQEMLRTYKQTAWNNLLNELNPEQLIVLKMVLEDCDEPVASAFFTGVVSGVIQFKHGKCPACGGEHAHGANHKIVTSSDTPGDVHFGGQQVVTVDDMLSPETEEGRAAMEAYNLDDVRLGDEENPGPIIGYQCKNCGVNYVSIEDRMLRAPGPEGCSGCIQKTKFG